MVPRPSSLETRWPQDPPTWSQVGFKTPNLEPRWFPDSQLGAKTAPRPLNLEIRWPPDPPTWSQDGVQTPQLGAKMASRPPTWPFLFLRNATIGTGSWYQSLRFDLLHTSQRDAQKKTRQTHKKAQRKNNDIRIVRPHGSAARP